MSRRGHVLALLCAVQFVLVLDVTIVGVALPSIRRELGFTAGGLQWVVSAYVLAFGGLLLLGGRLADVLGRRRLFGAGIAVFTLGSLACGLAATPGLLVAARAVQGVGAALATPAALALVTTTFPDGPERTRALGIWTAAAPVGGAAGLLVGGALTQGLGWPAIFLVNVPVGAVALLLTPVLLGRTAGIEGTPGGGRQRPARSAVPGTAGIEGTPGGGRQRPSRSAVPGTAGIERTPGGGRQRPSGARMAGVADVRRDNRRQRPAERVGRRVADVAVRVDAVGAALGTLAVVAVVFALTRTEAAGATDPLALLAAATAVAAGFGFVRWERRAPDPLLPPGTLRRRPLVLGVLVSLVLTAATSPPFFLITLHLQNALGWSPTAAGLGTLPVILGVIAGAALAPRAIAARAIGAVMAGGLALIAAGVGLLIYAASRFVSKKPDGSSF